MSVVERVGRVALAVNRPMSLLTFLVLCAVFGYWWSELLARPDGRTYFRSMVVAHSDVAGMPNIRKRISKERPAFSVAVYRYPDGAPSAGYVVRLQQGGDDVQLFPEWFRRRGGFAYLDGQRARWNSGYCTIGFADGEGPPRVVRVDAEDAERWFSEDAIMDPKVDNPVRWETAQRLWEKFYVQSAEP